MRDTFTTTVEAAAAWAREDAAPDRPTLAECVADEADDLPCGGCLTPCTHEDDDLDPCGWGCPACMAQPIRAELHPECDESLRLHAEYVASQRGMA